MSVLVPLLLAAAVLTASAPAAGDRLSALSGPAAQARSTVRRLRIGRRGRGGGSEVALALAEAVAPALQAGLSPGAALAHAARELVSGDLAAGRAITAEPGGGLGRHVAQAEGTFARWAAEVQEAVRAGEPVSSLLLGGANRLGSPELALLADAWSLTEATGGPLADAARTTAGLIRGATAQRRRLTAAVAGARSTMNILTVLPLGGPLLAMALGVDPRTLYLGSPLCTACLVLGVLLALAGRAWVRRLVAQAVEGPVVA